MSSAESSKKLFGAANFLLVFLVIMSSKTLYYEMFGTNLFVVFTLGFTLALFMRRNARINEKVVLFSYLFVLAIFLSLEFKISSAGLMVIKIFLALLIVSLVKVNDFTLYFSKIVKLISLVSLITYPIIFLQINSPLFDFVSLDERTHSNFILFSVTNNHLEHQVYRINGLWWEPGAFHLFFTLSFLFDYLYKRLNKVLTCYYLAVSLLIGSTTGLISIFLILVSNQLLKLSVKNVLYLIVISIMAAVIVINSNVLAKFDLENSVSLISRYHDFIISYNMFLEDPIFGYGYGTQIEKAIPFGIELIGYNSYFSLAKPTGADGITMFIAQVGLLGLPFVLLLLFPNYGTIKLSKMGRVAIALAILITFNTQNFTYQLIFNVLIVYSFVSWRYKFNYASEQ